MNHRLKLNVDRLRLRLDSRTVIVDLPPMRPYFLDEIEEWDIVASRGESCFEQIRVGRIDGEAMVVEFRLLEASGASTGTKEEPR